MLDLVGKAVVGSIKGSLSAPSESTIQSLQKFYSDNSGESVTDKTSEKLMSLFDIIGIMYGGTTVTKSSGGSVFVSTQDTVAGVTVSRGGSFNIPGLLGLGAFGGTDGFGIGLSPSLDFLPFIDLGIESSLVLGGADGLSINAGVYMGSDSRSFGFNAKIALASNTSVSLFHDYDSGANERTRDTVGGVYVNTGVIIAALATARGAPARNAPPIPQRAPVPGYAAH